MGKPKSYVGVWGEFFEINKKKREGDHITETMGVAGRGR
jgi:hypothetical protein